MLILASPGAFWVVKVVGAVYGAIFASRLAGWLQRRPRVVRSVNIGAGATFIAAGLSVLALKQRGAA